MTDEKKPLPLCTLCQHAPICKHQPQQSCNHFTLKAEKRKPEPAPAESPLDKPKENHMHIKWSAIVIGLLSGFGTLVVEILMIGLFLYLIFGESIASMTRSRGQPGLLMYLFVISVPVVTGYVTARLSRPRGVLHAIIAGLFYVVISLGGRHYLVPLTAIPLCVLGAMFTNQHLD